MRRPTQVHAVGVASARRLGAAGCARARAPPARSRARERASAPARERARPPARARTRDLQLHTPLARPTSSDKFLGRRSSEVTPADLRPAATPPDPPPMSASPLDDINSAGQSAKQHVDATPLAALHFAAASASAVTTLLASWGGQLLVRRAGRTCPASKKVTKLHDTATCMPRSLHSPLSDGVTKGSRPLLGRAMCPNAPAKATQASLAARAAAIKGRTWGRNGSNRNGCGQLVFACRPRLLPRTGSAYFGNRQIGC